MGLEKTPRTAEGKCPSEQDNFSYLACDAPHFISILSFKALTSNTRYTVVLFSHQIMYYIKTKAAPIQTVLGGRQKQSPASGKESKRGGHGRRSGRRRPRLPHWDTSHSASPALTPALFPSETAAALSPERERAGSGSHRLQPQEPAEPAPPQRPQLGRCRHLGAGAPLPAPPGAGGGPHPSRVTDTPPDAGEHRTCSQPPAPQAETANPEYLLEF